MELSMILLMIWTARVGKPMHNQIHKAMHQQHSSERYFTMDGIRPTCMQACLLIQTTELVLIC